MKVVLQKTIKKYLKPNKKIVKLNAVRHQPQLTYAKNIKNFKQEV